MGCDIHAVIEHYNAEDATSFPATAFSSEIGFGRDYSLFGFLAGVRSMTRDFIPPRGIPASPAISWDSEASLFLTVQDASCGNFLNHRLILRSEFEELRGSHPELIVKQNSFGETLIQNPSWHSISWLTLPELYAVRKRYLLDQIEYYCNISRSKRHELLEFIKAQEPSRLLDYVFPMADSKTLYSSLCTMRALEKFGDTRTRLVFWFDS